MSRSEAADRFYSRWARLYDYLSRNTPGVAHLRAETVDRMDLDPGMCVLDMGCGPGPNFPPVRDAIDREGVLVGMDVASGALHRAERSIAGAGWENVHAIRADATRPPVQEADALIAAFVIGMFDDPATVVDAWCSLVGSGGRIGLLHFARSDRPYGTIPNTALRGLVLASTPGKQRLRSDATELLDRRVNEGHAMLLERCDDFTHSTHWGGIAHILTGVVN